MGYAYQLSFHCGNLRRYILNFVEATTDFAGTRVGLHFSSNKTSSWFFAKTIFGSAICHFFTKLWTLRQDSAPPGRGREFSYIVISCRSQIGRKNVRPSRGVILCHLDMGKNFKPREKQFTRKALHRNDLPCSRLHDFYVKWARFALDHGIVCQNEAISSTRVALGIARNATDPICTHGSLRCSIFRETLIKNMHA
jgi:hypothetical protein